MKPAFLLLVLVHGLIHFMGFAKAFDLAPLAQLQEPIPWPLGVLWLLAGLLFLASAVLLVAAPSWWWVPAGVAIVVSQAVIVAAWGDAKFGTVANVVVLVPFIVAALGHAPWSLRARFEHDVAARLEEAPATSAIVSEADLVHLPAQVQRYLRFAGVVGKPRVWNYRLRFRGGLRSGPDSRWMPTTADQRSFADPPARFFLAESSMFGIPFTAFHRYVGPAATFEVRVASLVTMIEAAGPEMDRSETVTLLNDMCLFAPATLVGAGIDWEDLDSRSVRATYTHAGHTVTAVLSFDGSGALVNFVSDDRHRSTDGTRYQLLRWSTPIHAWREIDGRRVPLNAEATWRLPEGEFAYARFETVEVEYNGARR